MHTKSLSYLTLLIFPQSPMMYFPEVSIKCELLLRVVKSKLVPSKGSSMEHTVSDTLVEGTAKGHA